MEPCYGLWWVIAVHHGRWHFSGNFKDIASSILVITQPSTYQFLWLLLCILSCDGEIPSMERRKTSHLSHDVKPAFDKSHWQPICYWKCSARPMKNASWVEPGIFNHSTVLLLYSSHVLQTDFDNHYWQPICYWKCTPPPMKNVSWAEPVDFKSSFHYISVTFSRYTPTRPLGFCLEVSGSFL